MRVMAIDPSINNIGWAVAWSGKLEASGLIKTKGKTDGEKLSYIYEKLEEIVSNYSTQNYPIEYAYVDRTLYKGIRKNIQTIFKFSKSIGLIEFFFTRWTIPIKQPSLKLARKQMAIMKATDILNVYGDARKLTTHEAEAIVWAVFYSREVEHGTQ